MIHLIVALSVFSNTRYIGQDSFTLGMYFLERCEYSAVALVVQG